MHTAVPISLVSQTTLKWECVPDPLSKIMSKRDIMVMMMVDDFIKIMKDADAPSLRGSSRGWVQDLHSSNTSGGSSLL